MSTLDQVQHRNIKYPVLEPPRIVLCTAVSTRPADEVLWVRVHRLFFKTWKTSAVNTTDWMVEAQHPPLAVGTGLDRASCPSRYPYPWEKFLRHQRDQARIKHRSSSTSLSNVHPYWYIANRKRASVYGAYNVQKSYHLQFRRGTRSSVLFRKMSSTEICLCYHWILEREIRVLHGWLNNSVHKACIDIYYHVDNLGLTVDMENTYEQHYQYTVGCAFRERLQDFCGLCDRIWDCRHWQQVRGELHSGTNQVPRT